MLIDAAHVEAWLAIASAMPNLSDIEAAVLSAATGFHRDLRANGCAPSLS
jgi:hypothetical protein